MGPYFAQRCVYLYHTKQQGRSCFQLLYFEKCFSIQENVGKFATNYDPSISHQ
jgi:hypothetical protein